MIKNNQTLKETFLTAVENYQKKNFKNAEIICYKILSIDQNHFDSLSLLCVVGDSEEMVLKTTPRESINI